MKSLKGLFNTDITNLRGASSMIGKVQRKNNMNETKDKIKSKLEGVKKLWK